jgi:hypothetical protein
MDKLKLIEMFDDLINQDDKDHLAKLHKWWVSLEHTDEDFKTVVNYLFPSAHLQLLTNDPAKPVTSAELTLSISPFTDYCWQVTFNRMSTTYNINVVDGHPNKCTLEVPEKNAPPARLLVEYTFTTQHVFEVPADSHFEDGPDIAIEAPACNDEVIQLLHSNDFNAFQSSTRITVYESFPGYPADFVIFEEDID